MWLMVSGSEARALPGIEPDHKTIFDEPARFWSCGDSEDADCGGAGAVGVEFASIYNSFGTQVTILEALPRAVPVEDERFRWSWRRLSKEEHSDSDWLQSG